MIFRARFHYEHSVEYCFFVLLICLLRLELVSILSAERSIKATKNALFHARNGNEPLGSVWFFSQIRPSRRTSCQDTVRNKHERVFFNSQKSFFHIETLLHFCDYQALQFRLLLSIFFIYFISIFILLTRRKATEALIHKVSNYPDLLPEITRYCCPLVI